ncbi:ELMO/CED-12 family, putative [Trypanosoma equiperdum]|uniref:ELMO domain-containing protein n=2 Tax=Trypanozoon TaxID=39700 RepID=D0A2Z9_TRYB9|nr:hypothetical protein, conserved [Trypanosoma brucei gambiense DAL972]CBH15643.1 hypothetical protein, conserved [Trypanosoma brucei gambiense DAL972]SCU66444.1 ELMO/CED-12 family, putative [Trypanosoma equiperdum]|eukprot:XP_011777907.1 hypothetical protein, conserved [Trypanosoma brucei gambiense DAL972]
MGTSSTDLTVVSPDAVVLSYRNSDDIIATPCELDQQHQQQLQLQLEQQLHGNVVMGCVQSLKASEDAFPEAFSPSESITGNVVIADTSRHKYSESERESKSRKCDSSVPSIDWDDVNDATMRRVLSVMSLSHADTGESFRSISFVDAVRALKHDRSSWEPYAIPLRARGRGRCLRLRGFLRKVFFCCNSSSSLDSQTNAGAPIDPKNPKQVLQQDVDFCSTLPSMPFDHSNPIHRRLLITLRNVLIRDAEEHNGNVWNEWEKLGFQGSDPATDLRSTGLFGLLQLVFLLEYYRAFGFRLWDTCIKKGEDGDNVFEELPFVLIGFNFTGVVLDQLKDTRTHAEMMRRARSSGGEGRGGKQNISPLPLHPQCEETLRREFPFLITCCEYYVGCLFQFLELWLELKKQRGGRAPMIGDFNVVKVKLCASIKRKGAPQIFSACSSARHPVPSPEGDHDDNNEE